MSREIIKSLNVPRQGQNVVEHHQNVGFHNVESEISMIPSIIIFMYDCMTLAILSMIASGVKSFTFCSGIFTLYGPIVRAYSMGL